MIDKGKPTPLEKLVAKKEYNIARTKDQIKDLKAYLAQEEEALSKLKYDQRAMDYVPSPMSGTAPDGSDIYSAIPPRVYPSCKSILDT